MYPSVGKEKSLDSHVMFTSYQTINTVRLLRLIFFIHVMDEKYNTSIYIESPFILMLLLQKICG